MAAILAFLSQSSWDGYCYWVITTSNSFKKLSNCLAGSFMIKGMCINTNPSLWILNSRLFCISSQFLNINFNCVNMSWSIASFLRARFLATYKVVKAIAVTFLVRCSYESGFFCWMFDWGGEVCRMKCLISYCLFLMFNWGVTKMSANKEIELVIKEVYALKYFWYCRDDTGLSSLSTCIPLSYIIASSPSYNFRYLTLF